MGCTRLSYQTPFEEVLLTEEQHKLGFDDLDAIEVDLTVRKFCFNNHVTQTQLQCIEQELHLTLHDTGDWPEADEMMTYLTDSQGVDCTKLLVLGIMCSSAKPQTKARLLYEVYDPSSSSQLTAVKDLLKEMCLISSQVLGVLVPQDLRTAPEVECYQQKCVASADRAVFNLMKHFKTPVSRKDFKRILATLHDGLLLSPMGMRNYLYTEYSRNGPGTDYSNIRLIRRKNTERSLSTAQSMGDEHSLRDVFDQ
jgi:hypothetical protein